MTLGRRPLFLALAALLAVVLGAAWMLFVDTGKDVAVAGRRKPAGETAGAAKAPLAGADGLQSSRPVTALDATGLGDTAAGAEGAGSALDEEARAARRARLERESEDYLSRPVAGRVLLAHGSPPPEGLAVSISLERPPPELEPMRDMASASRRSQRLELDYEDGRTGWLSPEQLTALTRSAVAEDGSFVIERVPAGGGWVVVHDELLYADPAALIGRHQASVDVPLVRGARIAGRVLDEKGRPLADASVSVSMPMDPWMFFDRSVRMYKGQTGTADADGRFTLHQVPALGGLRIAAADREHGMKPTRLDLPGLAAGERRAVELVLREGNRVLGVLQDSEGAPIAKAPVELRRKDFDIAAIDITDSASFSRDGTTDDEGRFTFMGLGDGSYDVRAQPKGWRPVTSKRLELGEDLSVAEVLLETDEGLAIAGRVVGPDGEPVVRARIEVQEGGSFNPFAFGDRLEWRTRSDEDGAFRLGGFDPGEMEVSVRADGFRRARRDVAAGSEGVVLTLDRAASVSGVAVSLGDGELLSDFRVALTPAGGFFDFTKPQEMGSRMELARSESVSDSEDGSFTIDDVEPGEYELVLTAEGFETKRMSGLDVDAAGLRGLVVMVAPEASVSGVVVSARTGEPVEGATVTTGGGGLVEMLDGSLWGMGSRPETVTDAQGRFRLGSLAAGSVTLSLTHPRYRTLVLADQALDQGQARDVGVIRLSSGGAVHGRVLDERRRPLPGVIVLVSDATGSTMKRGTSDVEGRYRVEGLPPGSFNVMRMDFSMDLGGGGGAGGLDFMKDMVLRAVTLAEDEEKEVDLVTSSGEGTKLLGLVTAADGPVPDAMITVMPQRGGYERMAFTTTGPDGRYEMNVAPGDYAFQVTAGLEGMTAGSQPSSPVVEALTIGGAPEQRKDVTLPGGVLHGVVRSAKDGKALAGVRVLLERTDPARPTIGIHAALGGRSGESYSGEDGSFRFRYLPSGRYDVVAGGRNLLNVGTPGWAITRVADLDVLDGSPGFAVRVEVQPAGSIAGRALLAGGQPVAGLGVWARDAQGRWTSVISEVMPEASGRYVVPDLLPGAWTLAFRGQGAGLTLVDGVTVRAGETTPLDVTLPAGIALSLDTGDIPWSSLEIALDGPWGAVPLELVSLTDLMGMVNEASMKPLGTLPPGEYHLRVVSGGKLLLDGPILLLPGSSAHVVTLPAP